MAENNNSKQEEPVLLKEKPKGARRNSSEGIPPLNAPSRVGVTLSDSPSVTSRPHSDSVGNAPRECEQRTLAERNEEESSTREEEQELEDESIHSAFAQKVVPRDVLDVWEQDELEAKNNARMEKAAAVASHGTRQGRRTSDDAAAADGDTAQTAIITNGTTKPLNLQLKNEASAVSAVSTTHQPNEFVRQSVAEKPTSKTYKDNDSNLSNKKKAVAERISAVSAMNRQGSGEHGADSHSEGLNSVVIDIQNDQDMNHLEEADLATSHLSAREETHVVTNAAVSSVPECIPDEVLPQPGAVAVRGCEFQENELPELHDTLRYDLGWASSAQQTGRDRSSERLVNAFLVDSRRGGGGVNDISFVPGETTSMPLWRKRLCMVSLVVLALGAIFMIVGIILTILD